MKTSKLKIAVDMDEVVADLMGAWIKWGVEASGVSPVGGMEAVEWDVSKSFPSMTKKEVYGYLDKEGTFLKLKLIDGAKAGIKELTKYYDIYFLTAARNKTAASEKIKWVEKHFGHTLSNKVITVSNSFLKNVLSSSFSYIIDDNPKSMESAAESITTVLFTADHNKRLGNHKFDYRADNWEVLTEWLIEKHQSREKEMLKAQL